jgi:hypothetical protein
MTNSLITTTFNTQFAECLEDMSGLYPDDTKMKTYKRYVESVKKMNPSLLIKVWKRHVTDKYEVQIEAGNLDYFLNKDYKEDLMNVEKSQTAEEIIDDIRTRMKEMTEENRSRSVKYIQNLTALSKHYV